MKILIIAFDFPPVNRSAAYRPYSWAKYWARDGHEVKVLTTDRSRSGIPKSSPSIFPDLDRFEVIEASHMPWSKASPPRGAAGEGGGSAGGGGFKDRVMFKTKQSVRRVQQWIGFGSLISPTLLWRRPAIRAAKRLFGRWQPDVVVSTFGPAVSHLTAAALRKRFQFFWVGDYRDPWGRQLLYKVRSWVQPVERRLERKTMRACDLFTTVSDPLVQELREEFPGAEVLEIPNGFDPEEWEKVGESNRGKGDGVRLLYTGGLGLHGYDPEPLWQALALLKDDRAIVGRLTVAIGTLDSTILDAAVERWGIGELVENLGYLDRSDILQAQRDADGLVFLQWMDLSRDGVMSGKIFEYLASGTPILSMCGPADRNPSRLVEESGFGIALGADPQVIADKLREIASGGEIRYQPDRSLVAKFDRQNQARTLLAAVREQMGEGEG